MTTPNNRKETREILFMLLQNIPKQNNKWSRVKNAAFYNRYGVSFMHHKANTSGGIFLFY
jgi:hypothetical protein